MKISFVYCVHLDLQLEKKKLLGKKFIQIKIILTV